MKKRIFLVVLVVVGILVMVVAASPIIAVAVFQQKTAPVDMKEPIAVVQLTDPAIPNPLWPGTTLSWSFRVENVSYKDYWLQPYVQVTTNEGGIQYNQSVALSSGVKLKAYQVFPLLARGNNTVTITLKIVDSSTIAKGVVFTLVIARVEPPSTIEEKG